MELVRYEDPKEFASRTEPFLVADEARHNLLLGISSTLIERPEAYPEFHLWTVEEGIDVLAVAIRTPPFNLAVSRSGREGSLAFLANELAAAGTNVPGITGAVPEATEFTDAWTARAGRSARVAMASRIYELTSVAPVHGVSGRMREGMPMDRDLLVEWIGRFAQEALPNDDPMEPERVVDLRLHGRGVGLVLWDDGGSVSLAGYGGPTPNGIRIGPVYTPPELRRRGYASALVAALSQRLLDEGRTLCFLYTDLANPSSNRIYMNVGYRPVCDSMNYRFDASPPTPAH
jgi:predicted GNAT family acetyltransferase